MTFDLAVLIAYSTLTFGIGLCAGWLFGILNQIPRSATKFDAQGYPLRTIAQENEYQAYRRHLARNRNTDSSTDDPFGVQDYDPPAAPSSEFDRLTRVRGREYN